jgi:hypothetical protein
MQPLLKVLTTGVIITRKTTTSDKSLKFALAYKMG